MKVCKSIFTIICVIFFNLFAYSQLIENNNYKLLSLENCEKNIEIQFDYINDLIKVTLIPDEILCMHDFKGLETEICVIHQRFLQLSFKTSGGTGVRLRRVVLICVSEDKLFMPINVISQVSSRIDKTYDAEIDSMNIYDETESYELTISFSPDVKNLVLHAIETEKVNSKFDPKRDRETHNEYEFDFDSNNKIFFNQLIGLDGCFIIDSDDGTPATKKIFFGEKYPSIKLQNNDYYYIQQSWYIRDDEYHLTKFSNTCN
jgi:hypothetical protein